MSYNDDMQTYNALNVAIGVMSDKMDKLMLEQECQECHKTNRSGYFRPSGFICEQCDEEGLPF